MQRLGFIALAPTFITAMLLVTILTRHQLATLRVMARSTADAIAPQVASISTDPLRNLQRRELVRIAQSTGGLPHLAHVQIRAADGEILAGEREAGKTQTQAKDLKEDPAAWVMMVLAERTIGEEKRTIERLARHLVGRPGFEPGTNRLKVYCSTN